MKRLEKGFRRGAAADWPGADQTAACSAVLGVLIKMQKLKEQRSGATRDRMQTSGTDHVNPKQTWQERTCRLQV